MSSVRDSPGVVEALRLVLAELTELGRHAGPFETPVVAVALERATR